MKAVCNFFFFVCKVKACGRDKTQNGSGQGNRKKEKIVGEKRQTEKQGMQVTMRGRRECKV